MDLTQESPNYSYDAAIMALKGNRPEEAVSLFKSMLEQQQTPVIWSGMAYAKAALVLKQGSTIDEVAYCFKRAVESDPSQKKQIDALFADVCMKLMGDIAVYCQNLYSEAKKASNRIILGGLTVGLGSAVGLSKRNTIFTNLVGTAGVAGGAAAIFGSYSRIGDLNCDYQTALNLYNTVYYSCSNFISHGSECSWQFQDAATELKEQYSAISGRKASRGTMLLVMGLLSLFCCGLFLGIPTIILGAIDLHAMNNGKMDSDGKTKTIIGMVLAGVGVWIIGLSLFILFK